MQRLGWGLVAVWFALALAVAGCGNDAVGKNGNVVGGSCSASGGCAGGSVCLTDTMYPGGMCSIVCQQQSDCPNHTVCVQEGGGRCLLACSSASDCRSGYACQDKSTLNPAGHATVCIQ
jgi:hypothetical protein